MGVESIIPELSRQEQINLEAADGLVEYGVSRQTADRVVAKTLAICQSFANLITPEALDEFSFEEKAIIRKLVMDSIDVFWESRELGVEFGFTLAIRSLASGEKSNG